jgi:hypothetical protein
MDKETCRGCEHRHTDSFWDGDSDIMCWICTHPDIEVEDKKQQEKALDRDFVRPEWCPKEKNNQ